MQVLNTRMATHPMNYLIVFLMLAIAGMFGHLLLSYFGHEPEKTATPVQYDQTA